MVVPGGLLGPVSFGGFVFAVLLTAMATYALSRPKEHYECPKCSRLWTEDDNVDYCPEHGKEVEFSHRASRADKLRDRLLRVISQLRNAGDEA